MKNNGPHITYILGLKADYYGYFGDPGGAQGYQFDPGQVNSCRKTGGAE